MLPRHGALRHRYVRPPTTAVATSRRRSPPTRVDSLHGSRHSAPSALFRPSRLTPLRQLRRTSCPTPARVTSPPVTHFSARARFPVHRNPGHAAPRRHSPQPGGILRRRWHGLIARPLGYARVQFPPGSDFPVPRNRQSPTITHSPNAWRQDQRETASRQMSHPDPARMGPARTALAPGMSGRSRSHSHSAWAISRRMS